MITLLIITGYAVFALGFILGAAWCCVFHAAAEADRRRSERLSARRGEPQ